MRVEVNNQLRIENPSQTVKDWCKANLVLDNPDYAKKLRMNLWVGRTPEKLTLYEWDGDTLVLPYGCLAEIEELAGPKDSITITMPPPKMVWYGADIPLYNYQQEAVQAMQAAYYGILQAPAGSGKTQMGVAIATNLGRRALWLTHTHDLLQQSKERAEQYIDPSLIGTITEGQVQIGRGITFATVQTLSKLDLTRYKDMWDVIITDECHRVAGSPTTLTQFSFVLNNLAARHKYGLSATVHRADGLIKSTYALLGKVVYTVSEDAVADKIVKVGVLPRQTTVRESFSYLNTDGTLNYTALVTWLGENTERNEQIVNDLASNADHYNLILSDRVSHLRSLMESLPLNLRKQAVMIDGKMTSKKGKAERAQALEDMRRGTKRYLFATYALAKEGLDVPRLDRLYLTTPQKDYAVITQSLGRIARAFEGKDAPVCYDYVDTHIPYLMRAYKKRCTTYRKLKYPILEG